MDRDTIKKEIYNLMINDSLLLSGNKINYYTPLKEYGIDSVRIVDLIVTIEEKYLFVFNTEELELTNFKNIDTISELIFRKLQ